MTNPAILDCSPHAPRAPTVAPLMRQVLIALIPGGGVLIWLFGWGLLVNLVLAVTCALLAEALVMALRGRPPMRALGDFSAVVTAVLFALSVPPTLPWWMTLLGMLFAIVLVKQLYGGLGYNPFNPAMAAYVFLLVSYPIAMTTWLEPALDGAHALSWLDSARLILTGALPPGLDWDALTGATPLDSLRLARDADQGLALPAAPPPWGIPEGHGWVWVNLAFLLGGLYLLARRVITWHVPVSMLGTLAALATLFWWLDPGTFTPPGFDLFSGAVMLGAFFIATDPVSGCTTPRGQLIFGASVGAVVYVIRHWGGYPDAVAFAVLLMNIAAPTIDYYTRPRVFGHGRTRSPS